MEDKYLSKAKRIDNGDWLVGYVVKYGYTGKEKYYIVPSYASDLYAIEVDPSTICRSTGLKDKNDNLIWENDICNYYNSEDKDGIGIIKNDYVLWIDGTISMRHKMTPLFYLKCKDEWKVIGNIFDNPEMVNKKEETYCKDSNDFER